MKSLLPPRTCCFVALVASTLAQQPAPAAPPLTYEGTTGSLKGNHFVFIASDHEYKSEECLPELARILAKHHGAKCTVLFGVDPKTGFITPGNSNIPGTEALKNADLLVIFTRFQNLPPDQMQPIVDYLDRGGPVIGLRTATHGFKIPADSPFAKYDHNFKGDDFKGGFGRQILGETWVGHYGPNHKSSTRLDIVPDQASHPVLTGVKNVWSEIGAYNANPIEGSEILAMAQPLTGMAPDSPADETKKPMPGAGVRTYKSASGKDGPRLRLHLRRQRRTSQNEGFRRMLVNAGLFLGRRRGSRDQARQRHQHRRHLPPHVARGSPPGERSRRKISRAGTHRSSRRKRSSPQIPANTWELRLQRKRRALLPSRRDERN